MNKKLKKSIIIIEYMIVLIIVIWIATKFNDKKYLVGYGLSVLVGSLITDSVSRLFNCITDKYKPKMRAIMKPVPWIPVTLGIIERVTITTMVGFNVSAAGAFIGTWIVAKSALGWQIWRDNKTETRYERAIVYTGLLGSLISALIGVIGGLIIKGDLPFLMEAISKFYESILPWL